MRFSFGGGGSIRVQSTLHDAYGKARKAIGSNTASAGTPVPAAPTPVGNVRLILMDERTQRHHTAARWPAEPRSHTLEA